MPRKAESSTLAPESTWQPSSSSAFEPEEEIAPPEPVEKVCAAAAPAVAWRKCFSPPPRPQMGGLAR